MKLPKWVALSLLVLLAKFSVVQAEVRLPAVLTDHMVVQREKPILVWGWDDARSEVVVSIGGHQAKAKTDANGRWQVALPPHKAGGPHSIKIKGTSELTLTDVLVGEVWLCSGQSNMEWTVNNSNNPKEEVAAANHPQIRHIKIPHVP